VFVGINHLNKCGSLLMSIKSTQLEPVITLCVFQTHIPEEEFSLEVKKTNFVMARAIYPATVLSSRFCLHSARWHRSPFSTCPQEAVLVSFLTLHSITTNFSNCILVHFNFTVIFQNCSLSCQNYNYRLDLGWHF
jgi:hypothetical protein